MGNWRHFPKINCAGIADLKKIKVDLMSSEGGTSIQTIAHFKRSWKFLEVKVVRIIGFLGSIVFEQTFNKNNINLSLDH